MLLKKISIIDFRQFYGKVELKFSTSPKKNVTIIHGENGVGKTALLNAIKWVFFANFTSNFRNPNNLVNDSAQKEGTKTCRIEVEFEEDDRSFLLQRSFDQNTLKNKVKVYGKEGGVWGASLPEPELVINSMLPREMAEYFFFQGEGSNAVDAGNKEGNLAKSIRDILGFRVAESLKVTLKKMSDQNRRLIAQQDNSGKSEELNTIIQRAEDRLDLVNQTKVNALQLIPTLEKQWEEADAKLALVNNYDLETLRNEEKTADSALKRLRIDKLAIEKRKYSSIAKYGWAVFGQEFANSSLDFIDESQLKGRLPEPYNKTFIEDILSEGECICGSKLDIGSKGYKKIVSMLEKASNPQLLQRLSGIRAQIQDINTLNSVAGDTLSDIITQYDDCDERMQELSLKLKNLDEKISLIPEEQIGRLQTIKRKIKKDIGDQQQLLGGARNQISQLEESIRKDKIELGSLAANSEVVKALLIKGKFVGELNRYLTDYLAKMERNIRQHVITDVNKILKKFSRHDFHVKISKDDFRIYLKDKHNNNVAQGDGLNLLLNLTITASLINFVAHRRNVKDPILSTGTVAPLVIDAPFGVLDERYRNVVVKQLPRYASQVIFMVSTSQWTSEMEERVQKRIGAEYCLILEESAPQEEKPLDVVRVGDREIVASRYGCEVDRTVVEEIK